VCSPREYSTVLYKADLVFEHEAGGVRDGRVLDDDQSRRGHHIPAQGDKGRGKQYCTVLEVLYERIENVQCEGGGTQTVVLYQYYCLYSTTVY